MSFVMNRTNALKLCVRCSTRQTITNNVTTSIRRRYQHTLTLNPSIFQPHPHQHETQWFSGIQPTGAIHLGNYFGAVHPWVVRPRTPYEARMLVSVVDLHAVTMPQSPEALTKHCYEISAFLMAAQVTESASVFLQSHVPEHSELAWLLQCHTPHSWLTRMTQFKDKSKGKSAQAITHGLFAYPVLMAADVLVHRGTHVPVGDDQTQHLELTRDIAARFNEEHSVNLFPLPLTVKPSVNARVMSLRDGRKKMSKSEPNDNSRINMTDSDAHIAKKIRSAITDSIDGITYDPENRPELANLIGLLSACSNRSVEDIVADSRYDMKSTFKADLTEAVCHTVAPIREEYQRILLDRSAIEQEWKRGADLARTRAAETMQMVRKAMGLVSPI